jgi:hypothetical protein
MIKTSYSLKVAFQKNTFWAKKCPKRSLALFWGVKMVFLKTAPKMASKSIKNVAKKFTFTGPTDMFYNYNYSTIIKGKLITVYGYQ